jgi:6-phosphogluconate dehydrogenase
VKKCNLGFVGLGKMGSNLAQRLITAGYVLGVYDSNKECVDRLAGKGARGCVSLAELIGKLDKPSVILLCVPAGKIIDEIIERLGPNLTAGDTLIDLGNSFYQDTRRRAEYLKGKNLHYIDVGVSGGIGGAQAGACLMIGGDESRVHQQEKIFKALSKDGSYQYLGGCGAGHLVKGYHNLIEYGYLQSLAEGLDALLKVSIRESLPVKLAEVCSIWNQGSIIESRLIADAGKVFQQENPLRGIDGTVRGQTFREMQKLIKLAKQAGVKVYSCAAAVKARLDSQKKATESGKIVNAIRNVFGGHKEWKE